MASSAGGEEQNASLKTFSPKISCDMGGNPMAVVFLNVIFRAGEMVQQLIALVVLSEDMDSVFMGPSIGITHSHQ